jgi:hypothetical protein
MRATRRFPLGFDVSAVAAGCRQPGVERRGGRTSQLHAEQQQAPDGSPEP